jgi:hypothetical protein
MVLLPVPVTNYELPCWNFMLHINPGLQITSVSRDKD